MCRYCFNPYLDKTPDWSGPEQAFLAQDDMVEFHRSLDGYAPTPVRALPRLAAALGVGAIHVKDESQRFEVKAFKPLGASYAIYRFLKGAWEAHHHTPFTPKSFRDQQALAALGTFTFAAASDGNHGRAVAWTARRLAQRAVIYLPADTAQARIDAIESEGARTVLVPGSFDDCVRRCAEEAADNGWQVIADTAYPGYLEVPKDILLGYSTIFRELEDGPDPLHPEDAPAVDVVFLQAGVGGFASAGTSYYLQRYGAGGPRLVCVEPSDADCFLESVRSGGGEPRNSKGKLETMMVGLACGVPSLVAWPILRDGVDLFLACPDRYAVAAMRAYHQEGVVAGESGAAGLAGLLALLQGEHTREARERLGLGPASRILLINTEGDTDPINYRKITADLGDLGELADQGAESWPST